jgi:hypothetical protein
LTNPHHHGELGDVLHGLRLRLRPHAQRCDSTFWIGAFAFINGGLSMALMALGALAALTGGLTLAWVGSASLSLALTSGAMVWLRVPHPPAGATTLIVSLGILPRPGQLVALGAAILLLVLQALAINRLSGIAYPVWAPRHPAG